MKLFAKLKKIWSRFRTTLKFPNCEGGYESASKNFLKLCNEFCLSVPITLQQSKMGVTEFLFEIFVFKDKI